MAGEDEEGSGEKEYEPSQRRLDQAREQGDIIRSEDLQTAASTGGLVLALLVLGSWAVTSAGRAGMVFLDQVDKLAAPGSTGAAAQIGGLSFAMGGPLLLILAGPAATVLLYLLATQSLVFASSKLEFKGSRLSILENAKQKFGRAGLLEFVKRAAKMLAVGGLLAWFLNDSAPELFLAARLEPGPGTLLLTNSVLRFLKLFLVIALVFGLADYLWQKAEYARRNRMTRKEMTDEMKESEGDPHFKADRRRRGQEIAMNRMLADVPTADVIIVNPTHYAVALKWDRRKKGAPKCVAKGVDEIAARIRERAAEAGVPIRRDPPTARALYAGIEIGQEINAEHYAAVAAAIRFSDAIRKKAKRK